jgi:cobalamin biosynthesis Co2+ chelatase CbiK
VKGMKKSVLAIFLVIFLVSCGAARHKFTPPNDGKMYVYIEDDYTDYRSYSAYKKGIIIRLEEEAKSDLFCDEEAIKKFKEAYTAYNDIQVIFEVAPGVKLYITRYNEITGEEETETIEGKRARLGRPYRDDALILLFEAINIHNANPRCVISKEK